MFRLYALSLILVTVVCEDTEPVPEIRSVDCLPHRDCINLFYFNGAAHYGCTNVPFIGNSAGDCWCNTVPLGATKESVRYCVHQDDAVNATTKEAVTSTRKQTEATTKKLTEATKTTTPKRKTTTTLPSTTVTSTTTEPPKTTIKSTVTTKTPNFKKITVKDVCAKSACLCNSTCYSDGQKASSCVCPIGCGGDRCGAVTCPSGRGELALQDNGQLTMLLPLVRVRSASAATCAAYCQGDAECMRFAFYDGFCDVSRSSSSIVCPGTDRIEIPCLGRGHCGKRLCACPDGEDGPMADLADVALAARCASPAHAPTEFIRNSGAYCLRSEGK